MENLSIRLLVDEKGLRYNQIAKEMGVNNCTLSRYMGSPLSLRDRLRIMRAINNLLDGELSEEVKQLENEYYNQNKEERMIDITKLSDEELLKAVQKLREQGLVYIGVQESTFTKSDIISRALRDKITASIPEGEEYDLSDELRSAMVKIADILMQNYIQTYYSLRRKTKNGRPRFSNDIPGGKVDEYIKIIEKLADIIIPYYGIDQFKVHEEQKEEYREESEAQENPVDFDNNKIARSVIPMNYKEVSVDSITVGDSVYHLGEQLRIVYDSMPFSGYIKAFGKNGDMDCIKLQTEKMGQMIIPVTSKTSIAKHILP